MKTLLAVLLLAAPASAAWRDIPATDFTLAPPPAAGSPEYDKDISVLLQAQAERTPGQCALARTQKTPDFHSLWDSSGLLSKAELAAVGPFVDSASKYASKVSGHFKKKYARPRPYDEDARVEPCAEKPGGATSYPSTHATDAAVDACVLSRLFPARMVKLTAYGKMLGDLRVVVGVHHPTDVAAGQDLAGQVCARLTGEPDFSAELDSVRATLPPAP